MHENNTPGRVIVGNAAIDGTAHRGWILGHFAGGPGAPMRTEAVEVKWGVHPAGERRSGPAVGATATSLSLLLRGRFRLDFPERSVVLEREGDYALWPPGVAHDWHAEQDSVVITIRWPSLRDEGSGLRAQGAVGDNGPERSPDP